MANSVITLTTAPTGTGKTYVRCGRFLWDEWLKENEGVHYSNFPIRFEPWEDEWGRSGRGLVAEAVDRLGISEEEVRKRIQVIPPEETAKWERDSGEFGPWSTFEGIDLDGAHIAIDESHIYWPAKGAIKRCKALMEWIADVRHRGCTVEFITQNRMQVSPDLRRAINREIRLSRWDDKYEPVLGIRIGDYLEVLAAFTGQYRGIVREDHLVPDGEKLSTVKSKNWDFDPFYFSLFNSHSAPAKGGKGGLGAKPPHVRYRGLRIFRWFLLRNWFPLSWRSVAVVGFYWLVFAGGAAGFVQGIQQEFIEISMRQKEVLESGQGGDAGSVFIEEDSPEVAAYERGKVNGAKGELVPIPQEAPEVSFPAIVVGRGGEQFRFTVEGSREEALDQFSKIAMVYAVKYKEVMHTLEVAEDELQTLRDKLGELGSVVLVSEQGAQFANGDWYSVGELINWGPYRGLRVESVDLRRRAVRLSDGRLLRVGVSRLSEPEGTESFPTRVSQALRNDNGKRGSDDLVPEGSGDLAPFFGAGDDPGGTGPISDGSIGGFYRGGRGPGDAPRLSGDRRSAVGRGAGLDRGQVGRGFGSTR